MAPHDELASRMKSYETATDIQLPADKPAIIRIDGHAFSTFTRGFEKPFDERIHTAMAATASDLLAHFPAATVAYTNSDEITLVFPNGVKEFKGRVAKLGSLAAGLASARFNHHLVHTCTKPVPPEKVGTAHFDARAFTLPSVDEVLHNLIWRAKIDGRRNSISGFGRSFFTTKQLHGLGSNAIVEKVLSEKGIDYWTSTPTWARYGTTVKREKFLGTGVDGLTGEPVTMTRTRMKMQDTQWWEFNEDNLLLITDKFWK
ncbi:Thg1 domain-containing protein [Mycena indigotica]|uniref:tRNA(His) guanylyltransferase n=1 Tax=Mycena indigotica TaxID=2126181 RepID=A0A8H6WC51_9AGAR|nr:Thg1 domain-containing protein [Mycena indigotica]KAF7312467.1 Thg1 domain-containing protein [Mycena indigotica]